MAIMASISFSHILLILALGTWILALFINLFFPVVLYSINLTPGILGAYIAKFASILDLISAAENNTFAMLCFLLAMACSFVAGAVYGMEREFERLNNLYDFQAKDAADFEDLEKGQWEHEEYCEKDVYPYTTVEEYTDVPLKPSTSAQATVRYQYSPEDEAMTQSKEYYPSIAEINDNAAQKQALLAILSRQTRQQNAGCSSLELHLAEHASFATQTQAHHSLASYTRHSEVSQQAEDDQYPYSPFPLYRLPTLHLVFFADRELAQEKKRLQKELARLMRNRVVRKKEHAREKTAKEMIARMRGAGKRVRVQKAANKLGARLAAVVGGGPYNFYGSVVIQGSMSGFDASSGVGVTEDGVWDNLTA